MNDIFLSNQVLVYLLSESILFVLLFIAFIVSVKILLKWKFDAFTPEQFNLEKSTYLVNTIIFIVFVLKFILLLYFVFSIDALALLIPGAMCGAGVITANEYGSYLLILKLFILFCLTLWMVVHRYDLQTKNYLYLKQKLWLFGLIFLLICVELGLDLGYFSHIDTHLPVSCCSTLFGQLEGANPLPFGLNIPLLLVLFYLLYALIIVSLLSRQTVLYIVSNLLFIYIAYYAVVYFFGTYIYQLPTHKCPFCMMQADYAYVGYLLWGTLLIGSYLGLSNALSVLWLNITTQKRQIDVMLLLSFFVLLCSAYVGIYYIQKGVLLS